MRGANLKRLQHAALVSGLFCAACDPPIAKSASASVVCSPEQILGTDKNRQLVCLAAPPGKIVAPYCAEAMTSDGVKLTCTSAHSSADTDADAAAALRQLDGAALRMAGMLKTPAAVSHYVGVSLNLTSGFFVYNNFAGIAAASLMCDAQYGTGSHLCGMDELYHSVVDGTLGATSSIGLSWAYVPNWNLLPLAGAASPLEGLGDNCGGYSSRSGSTRWRGILVEWGPLPDGSPGFRWHGGDAAACGSSHPVSCCK